MPEHVTSDRPKAPAGFTWQLHCDRCGMKLSSPRGWPSHLLSTVCQPRFAEQDDLDGRSPLDQPSAKVRRDAPATSLAAAVEAAKVSGGTRRRVLQAIILAEQGLTDDQLVDQLDANPSTVRPRRLELVEARYVEPSGDTRPTRSGAQATVWVATPAGHRAWRDQRPDR